MTFVSWDDLGVFSLKSMPKPQFAVDMFAHQLDVILMGNSCKIGIMGHPITASSALRSFKFMQLTPDFQTPNSQLGMLL